MPVPFGYRPENIVTLKRRTERAIADLARLDSSDPAAAEAAAAIRGAREQLEQHWMPLLTRIERCDAMVTWTRSSLDSTTNLLSRIVELASGWFTFDERSNRFAELSDEELVVALMDAQRGRNRAHYGGPPEAFDDDLGIAIASRVDADPEFATRLVDEADEYPVLGAMLANGGFPVSFVTALTRRLITIPDDPIVPFDKDARSIDTSAALDYVAAHHAAIALELLNEHEVVEVLVPRSQEDRIDQGAVERFVTVGLYDAVLADATRLEDSFRALGIIIGHGRGDDVNVGVLRGVVNALPAHIPDMSRYLLDGAGSVIPAHSAVDLGSYADLAAFYGGAMGDPAAQTVAGGVITAHIEATMRELGPLVLDRNLSVDNPGDAAQFAGFSVNPVSNLVDLLFNDGIPTEQQRRNMEAGAEQAARDGWFKLFSVGTSVVPPLANASKTVRTVAKLAGVGTSLVDDIEADQIDDQGDRFSLPQHVESLALELIGNAPELYSMANIAQMSPAGLALVADLATKLEDLTSPRERAEALRDLDALDDVDRVIIDRFLGEAVDSSGAKDNADLVVRAD